MKRALLVLGLCGCTFAAKHPAVTVGIAAGSIGFGACALNVDNTGTCAMVGGAAGLGLGVITWVVTMLGNASASEEVVPDATGTGSDDDDPNRIDTVTEPPPGLPAGTPLDAGVPAAPADAAP